MKKANKKVEEKEQEVKPSEEVNAEVKAPESKAENTAKTKADEEADKRADAILKRHEAYAKLYIDSKGGVFTETTPAHIRGNAKLYVNKYYK